MNVKSLNKSEQVGFDRQTTTSGRIRFLNSLSWTRGDISRYLGIRYQWVRNVLVTPVKEPRDKI